MAELVVRGGSPRWFAGEPWLYAGGVVGIGVIAVATTVVRRVGVLVFGLASVAGQLLGAVALDTLAAGSPPVATTWIAVAVTFVAVVLVMRTRHSKMAK